MHPDSVSHLEYNQFFDISFTRKGRFGYHVGRHSWDIDSRVVLLCNAESEYKVSHGHRVCDENTIVQVNETVLAEAQRTFWRKDSAPDMPIGTASRFLFPQPVLATTPGLDHLHQQLQRAVAQHHPPCSLLQIDDLLVQLVEAVFRATYGWRSNEMPPPLNTPLKRRHLVTIEQAKHFMLTNFQDELSLEHISRAVYVSPFHFSRLFKQLTGHSPYQYLIQVRLHHASLLLRNTSDSVTEVCFASGFNSLSHFIETFTRHFGASPSQFRLQ